MHLRAGLDAGSVSVKLVLLDGAGRTVFQRYQRHQGRPLQTALALLHAALAQHGPLALTVTGTAGKHIARHLDLPHVNELLALARALALTHPEVRTVLEMGGEDAKLLLLDHGSVRDFALNSVCAAGTGTFLDQQAERLGLDIQAFADLAVKSERPSRVAGRCSVFAKSDLIHLQQIAAPLQDMVAGLCFAVARNFRGSIVRARKLPPQVAFLGGVALNRGVQRAFREVLGLDALLTPEDPTLFGALGAALAAGDTARVLDLPGLERIAPNRVEELAPSPFGPLVRPGEAFFQRHDPQQCTGRSPGFTPVPGAPPLPAYLGIDIGSISTCLAVLNDQGTLLAKRYLRTAGRPIEAVKQGLAELRAELGTAVEIRGVGTTGSGRYMIADCVGADLVKNEITAQARGAVSLDALRGGAGVDTVLEIGGQDSKYIQLQDGIIVDFEMNKACAAGTGSFLEEQAEKLSVSVKGEFAALALEAETPCALGERCTVFMENSLQNALQQGAGKDALLAGLAYSIVENYINRVVAGRPIGQRVFFQGGTACNKAVVAAFEKFLGREIVVPPHTDVSGAIGMALLAREHMQEQGLGHSAFKGFGLADRGYEQSSFTCQGCENHCEINRIRFEGEQDSLCYGGRCEKYDIRRRTGQELPDLCGLRREALEEAQQRYAAAFQNGEHKAPRGVLGLPRVFFMHDLLPYYATLLWELGFEVRLTPPTDRRTARLGLQTAAAETCFPLKASLGHLRRLLDEGVTRLFLPSFVNLAEPDSPAASALACPLTQSFPYQARQFFPEAQLLVPVLQYRDGRKGLFTALCGVFLPLGVPPWELWRAMVKAQAAQVRFRDTMREAGTRTLAELDALGAQRVLVLIGRSYNALDEGLNLGLPRKLASLNTLALPMDCLPLEDEFRDAVHPHWPELYWRSGQRMLAAASAVRKDPRLDALVIGSFSCGPDSFILEYLHRELAAKPFLHIEIDEHSADAGVVTRCEAFLDSLAMRRRKEGVSLLETQRQTPRRPLRHQVRKGPRRVFIPRMGDQAFGLQAAFRAGGVEAEVMPLTDHASLALARRHVSGKECFPFLVTTADMLQTALRPDFRPEESAFFLPSGTGPCRYGQYNLLQKMLLEEAGFPEVPILSPVQDSALYAEMGYLGKDFARIGWKGILAFDLLVKLLHATRPYEAVPGSTEALYADACARIPELLAGALEPLAQELGRYAQAFAALKAPRSEPRPWIGIVGEIFVRTNTFSNENLVAAVEALGGEAWLASIDEWVYYVNWCARRNALKRLEFKSLAQVLLKDRIQKRMAHRLEVACDGLLRTIHDPATATLLRKAAPYLHHSMRGEAVLSVGKALDMMERGVHGIIVAMPFGCMPGSVAATLLHDICERRKVPMISIPYDGTPSVTMQLQLEAFMAQAARGLENRPCPAGDRP